MRKGLTEMVFVLDRSGSMTGLEKDTIGGFNSMIARQKKEEGDAIVTTVLFDSEAEELHSHAGLNEISEMTEEDYVTRGTTALNDALGNAITKTRDLQSYLKEEDKPEKTIFVVITDGYENSSRKFRNSELKDLVEQQKEKGWEFLFLGANIDAFAAGRRIGISSSRICKMAPDSRGTELAYKDVGNFINSAKLMEHTYDIDESWCDASASYCMEYDEKSV